MRDSLALQIMFPFVPLQPGAWLALATHCAPLLQAFDVFQLSRGMADCGTITTLTERGDSKSCFNLAQLVATDSCVPDPELALHTAGPRNKSLPRVLF